MIYGTVHATRGLHAITADLTDRGWVCADPIWLAGALNEIDSTNPREFGPSDGDPMNRALSNAAKILGGTYTLTPLRQPPPGTIF